MGESETGEEQNWVLVVLVWLPFIHWLLSTGDLGCPKGMLILHITTWLMSQGDEAGSSKCLKQQVSEKQEIHSWKVLYGEW